MSSYYTVYDCPKCGHTSISTEGKEECHRGCHATIFPRGYNATLFTSTIGAGMPIPAQKLDPLAVLPSIAKHGDAGLDLTALEIKEADGVYTARTGLALEIPYGFVGLLFPRSSIFKTGWAFTNSVGVIDSGFRGELTVKFKKTGEGPGYSPGDRVAQLVILPIPEVYLKEVETLTPSQRGTGGFGSSGR